MPSTSKHGKGSTVKPRNSNVKTKAGKESVKLIAESSSDHEISDDEEDDGVDEEGMARLMKALGDDGLDEFGQAQLQSLAGDEDEEDEDEDDVGSDEESGVEIDEEDEVSEDEGEGDENEIEASEDGGDEEEEDEGPEEDEDVEVPLDEVESVDEDAVPRQKIEIDNKVALEQIRESIQLDPSFPWTETLVLSYPQTIDVDVNDDLNRELAFYKQALHGANAARVLAAKHKFPFTRPSDYFAEMIKSDAHMERIRQRLLDESAGIKKSEDKRKEREGKKFGKQVQIEKLKEREKSKKEMEERLKGLKRKRGDVLDNRQGGGGEDDFDIAVEDAISDRPAKRGKPSGKSVPRSVRDKKYGFGGATRRSKQNTRESTDNFSSGSSRGRGGFRGGGRGGRGGGSGGRGRGGSKRLGKSRRATTRSKS